MAGGPRWEEYSVIRGGGQTVLLFPPSTPPSGKPLMLIVAARYANIDLKTQEAYELAVKGLIRPMEKSPPLITAVRCLQFAPPEFQLEMHCLHETQQYLRKIVHEIGLELKSSAVCTQVRRIRDGVFVLDDALLRTEWDLGSIQKAIQKSKHKVEAELQNTLAHQEARNDCRGKTVPATTAGDTECSRGEDALLTNP